MSRQAQSYICDDQIIKFKMLQKKTNSTWCTQCNTVSLNFFFINLHETAWQVVFLSHFVCHFSLFKTLFSIKNIVNFYPILCGTLLLTLNYESSNELKKKIFSIFAPKLPAVLGWSHWLAPLWQAALVTFLYIYVGKNTLCFIQ